MTENAKKIFEILGIEPDEEFKIEDKNCFWKIDEKLNLYYRQGHYDNGDYAYNGFNNSLIIDLIKNPELIIKLPKESMKKKIGDLTIREAKEMQDKICNVIIDCKDCPFCDCCINDCIDLDQEIEVEE